MRFKPAVLLAAFALFDFSALTACRAATLSAPPGFHVEVVSSKVPGARFIAVAPNGDVIVSETTRGRVVAIRAGAAADEEPTVILDGVELPHGLAFRGDDLYVATWSGVLKGRYVRRSQLKPKTLVSDMPESGDHNDRALALAGDGTIYVSSGSDCNVCVEPNPRLATLLRYDADGRNGTIYASGLRNASGLAFDARGVLWAVVNQRDNVGPSQDVTDNLPPDELIRIKSKANYGWPYCYPSHHMRLPNPEFDNTKLCKDSPPADFEIQAHSAPLGIQFYEGKSFPSRYRGAAFVALHGSWNRSSPAGDKVVAIFFRNGQPESIEDFVTGWLQPNGWYAGRPVGVAVARDGSLYISDDSGFVFKVKFGS